MPEQIDVLRTEAERRRRAAKSHGFGEWWQDLRANLKAGWGALVQLACIVVLVLLVGGSLFRCSD